MQKVDKHIGELLYEYNCVIIPTFGGFVANYLPAKIHPVLHLLSPPSKHIVFNKNLKNNDGLLAHQIATTENIDYTAALEQITVFVNGVNTRLKKGEKATIACVGTLFLDVERNIQFTPDTFNFLTESFGLTEFQSPAIKQGTIGKKIETNLKKELTKVVDLNSSRASAKRSINYRRVVAVAAAVPLIAGIVWISLKTDVLHNVNYSNLNPFASKSVIYDTIIIDTHGKTKIQIDSEIQAVIGVKPAIKSVTPVLMNTPLVEADTAFVTKAAEMPVSMKYHIVTGCFQMEENAKHFITSLQQQNIEGAIIGKNNKGLYVVSSGNFSSKEQAAKELKTLKQQQPNAWLFESN
jgi:hypothetical protein